MKFKPRLTKSFLSIYFLFSSALEYRLSNPATASVVNGDIFQYADNEYNNAHQYPPSSGNNATMMGGGGGGRPSQIQVDFIQKMIDEAMEENRYDILLNLSDW